MRVLTLKAPAGEHLLDPMHAGLVTEFPKGPHQAGVIRKILYLENCSATWVSTFWISSSFSADEKRKTDGKGCALWTAG